MDETVNTDCPTCGDDTDHDVLKTTDASVTVQCQDCSTVRTFSPPRMRIMRLPLVVSNDKISWSTFLETASDDEIAVGYEFELEGDRMLVTGLEAIAEGKHTKARASDLKLVQAKVFNAVTLKLSLNEGDKTTSFEIRMDPDHPVQIGEVYESDGRLMAIKTLKSDMNRTIHKGFLLARNVRRAFCDAAPSDMRPGDFMGVRRRGAPANRKGDGPTSRVRAPNAINQRSQKR